MLPMPTSRVFRSRGGALRWSFWVIVAAVLTAGFAGDRDDAAPANQADVAALMAVLDAR